MGVMGELCEVNVYGDTKTIWDTDNEDEVEAARKVFNDLRKKNFTIFRVGKDGEKSKRMDEFDPEAGKMIAVPRIVGG